SAGAEEALQEGIRGFARTHFAALPRRETWFLNVDTVGSGRLVLLEGKGRCGCTTTTAISRTWWRHVRPRKAYRSYADCAHAVAPTAQYRADTATLRPPWFPSTQTISSRTITSTPTPQST